MKKFFLILVVVVASLVLAGCSTDGGNNTATTAELPTTTIATTTTIPGDTTVKGKVVSIETRADLTKRKVEFSSKRGLSWRMSSYVYVTVKDSEDKLHRVIFWHEGNYRNSFNSETIVPGSVIKVRYSNKRYYVTHDYIEIYDEDGLYLRTDLLDINRWHSVEAYVVLPTP